MSDLVFGVTQAIKACVGLLQFVNRCPRTAFVRVTKRMLHSSIEDELSFNKCYLKGH